MLCKNMVVQKLHVSLIVEFDFLMSPLKLNILQNIAFCKLRLTDWTIQSEPGLKESLFVLHFWLDNKMKSTAVWLALQVWGQAKKKKTFILHSVIIYCFLSILSRKSSSYSWASGFPSGHLENS